MVLPYCVHCYEICIDVGMMFYGRNNSEVFYSLPESEDPRYVFGFTASSALIILFGDNFLRRFRWTKTKVSDVELIFGINDSAIIVGRNIADVEGSMLVYGHYIRPIFI